MKDPKAQKSAQMNVPERPNEEMQAVAIKVLFGDNPTQQQLAQLTGTVDKDSRLRQRTYTII